MSDDDILTIREVAVLLKIGETTSDTMTRVGNCRASRCAGSGVSDGTDSDQWIARQVVRGAESDREGESR